MKFFRKFHAIFFVDLIVVQLKILADFSQKQNVLTTYELTNPIFSCIHVTRHFPSFVESFTLGFFMFMTSLSVAPSDVLHSPIHFRMSF